MMMMMMMLIDDDCCSNSPRHSQLSGGDGSAVHPGTVSTGPTSYSYDDDARKSHASERAVDLLPDPFQSSKSDADADPGGAVPQPLRVPRNVDPQSPVLMSVDRTCLGRVT